jgi:hypothetical protein
MDDNLKYYKEEVSHRTEKVKIAGSRLVIGVRKEYQDELLTSSTVTLCCLGTDPFGKHNILLDLKPFSLNELISLLQSAKVELGYE